MNIIDGFKVDDIINQRVSFEVPLDYENKNSNSTITVVGNLCQKYDANLHSDLQKLHLPKNPKLISYIQGGPGFPCAVPLSNSGFTKVLIEKGYQVFFMDQRGTGLSTPIEVNTFKSMVFEQEHEDEYTYVQRQIDYILKFRADSIVSDLEYFRKQLLGDKKWSLLGQSYGGFCCFTYLSKYPEALKEVLITGGVPPINLGPDDVYKATYERTAERNIHYYKKYPQDIRKVKNILNYLDSNDVILPNGGKLSVERFQQLGLNFGGTGGTDSIHQIVFKLDYDLSQFGFPTYQSLTSIQNEMSFDTNAIYALFQEAIYMDGSYLNDFASRWSADRLRYSADKNFLYSKDFEGPIYFTGEMVYRSMFDDYVELRPFKELANALHERKQWSKLYDVEKLRRICWEDVPIVAATYFLDQYVDFDLVRKVKKEIFTNSNLKLHITSEFFHNGLRANPESVLGSLFNLLECDID